MVDKVTWYHADDFGVSLEQSEKILSCYQEGALNSISILPMVPDVMIGRPACAFGQD